MWLNSYSHFLKATIACTGLLFSSVVLPVVHAQEQNVVVINPTDSPADIVRKAANVVPSERQFNWQRQELTAFLHYGVNTYTGREWGDGKESPAIFNPTDLDADQWIRELKSAGFKCAILTCKHHDGFCLWPSAYTEHSVKHSPWKDGKGDVVREVSDACKKYGMDFGVYLSPWDRNSELYGTDAYNDFFVKQLTELLTQYGKVSEVWFDGACGEGPNGKKQEYDFVRWYELIRKLQPEAVIAVMGPDVRWVGTETGRGREMEWSVVPKDNLDQDAIAKNSQQEVLTAPVGDMMGQDLGSRKKIEKAKSLVWYPAEIDVSIRPGWFYHEAQDSKVKSPKELMDIYFTSVGMNGVLLLNLPPNKEGKLADADVRSLRGFRQLYATTFTDNLLANAKVTCALSEGKRRNVVDHNYDTSVLPKMKDGKAVFQFKLKNPATFNVLSVQEDIRKGQRVEKFSLEVKDAKGNWKKVTEGTTVGHKRLLKFPVETAKEVRLIISEVRAVPAISEIGLYRLRD
ncbi:alpha-L-fucosidase [Prevotella fusca]